MATLPYMKFPDRAILNPYSRWGVGLTMAAIAQRTSGGIGGKYTCIDVAGKSIPVPPSGTQYCAYKEGVHKYPGITNVTASQGDVLMGSHFSSRGMLRFSNEAIGDYTVALIGTVLATPGAEGVYVGNGRHDLPGFYISTVNGLTGGLRFLCASNNTYNYSQGTPVFTVGELFVFVARGIGGGNIDLFGNGDEVTYNLHQANPGMGDSLSYYPFYFGGVPGYYNDSSGNLLTHAVLVWRRALSNLEIKAFSLQPFEVFTPQFKLRPCGKYVSPVTGGAIIGSPIIGSRIVKSRMLRAA